jgi:hypothetical protein
MWTSYAVGLIGITVVLAAWIGVQNAWRRTFPELASDPDTLAGRMGCQGCACTEVCERRLREGDAGSEEEDS